MGLIDKVNVEVNGSGDVLSTLSTYTTKILKPNIIDGKNVLTQQMVNAKNTKYVIKYDFELEEDITVPANCVLEFDGGSISEGNITFTDTIIISEPICIFNNCNITGEFGNDAIYLSWLKFSDIGYYNATRINNFFSAAKEMSTVILDFDRNIILGVGDGPISPSINSNNIIVSKAIKIIQTSSFYIKAEAFCEGGEVLRINSENVSIEGLKIDANNYAINCIGLVISNNVKIKRCECINAGYNDNVGGGKGIHCDLVNVPRVAGGGVAIIDDCTIKNCKFGIGYNAYSTVNPTFYAFPHYYVSNCVIEECESAFWLASIDSYTFISNVIVLNCSGENGVIQLIDARNVSMNNIKIVGDTELNALFVGCSRFCNFNITLYQPCNRIIDISRTEQSSKDSYLMYNIYNVICTNSIGSYIGFKDHESYDKNIFIEKNILSIIGNNISAPTDTFKEGTSSKLRSDNILNFVFTNALFRGSVGEFSTARNYRLEPRDKRHRGNAANLLGDTVIGEGYWANDMYLPVWNNGLTYVNSDGRTINDCVGTTRPKYRSDFDFGKLFLDTSLNKYIYPIDKSGENFIWVEYDGARAGVLRSGTFAQKPTSNYIYVGFKYFCTDKQTTEGATNGIEIIHKGNDVWVDALGRVVS